uniref:Uncharacterized protein n=1 Tax=Physcomitrium patens TaxID=3218 RepID=A0A2K1L8J5_PHYPA|nr:hypothetical protein PHYPA_000761 [Physcomitrium patens]
MMLDMWYVQLRGYTGYSQIGSPGSGPSYRVGCCSLQESLPIEVRLGLSVVIRLVEVVGWSAAWIVGALEDAGALRLELFLPPFNALVYHRVRSGMLHHHRNTTARFCSHTHRKHERLSLQSRLLRSLTY